MRPASKPGWPAVLNQSNSPAQVPPSLSQSLSEAEVRRLLEPGEAVTAIEQAFGADYGSFVAPPRQHFNTQEGVFLLMPCYHATTGKLGVKLVAVASQAKSGSTVQASYLLLDTVSAQPQLFLAANWLTDLRTAATSFVATKFLARSDARVLGIFGTGRQAHAHIEVFARLRKFDSILVCGSSLERSRNFVDHLRREFSIEAEAADARTCARQAEIICACTTARRPLFDGSWLRPGTHLNLVGAFQPESREVDTATIRSARVVVDSYAGALDEAGDLLIPMSEGAITRQHIYAELHEIVSRLKPARQKSEEITVFKSVGCALEDLAVAEVIATKLERGPQ